MTADTATPRAKLPWRTIVDAYRVTWANKTELLQLSWFWLLLILPPVAVLNALIWPVVKPDTTYSTFAWISAPILPEVIGLFAGASVAVGWHRLILNGEHPAAGRYFRVDITTVRYFSWIIFQFFLVLAPILIPVLLLASGASDAPTAITSSDVEPPSAGIDEAAETPSNFGCTVCALAIGLVLLMMMALLSYIPTRLSLILPAVALNNQGFDIPASWRSTRSNFWRLFWGFNATILAPLAFVMVLADDTDATRTLASHVTFNIAITLYGFTVGMIAVTYLSLAYRYLVGIPNQPDPAN